jgi:hypothetical protein
MRAATLSNGLLLIGALVGVATGAALALGLRVDQLPSWMITVGMYKLAFIAAGGLLVAGALVGRAAHNALERHPPTDANVQLGEGPGVSTGTDTPERERDPVKRDRRNA